MTDSRSYTAFAGTRLIATGGLAEVVRRTKERLDTGETETVLVFDDRAGTQIDFDFRGTPDEVVAKLASHPLFAPIETPPEAPPAPRTGPGRPKLGVVSREVSLLPRHWDWLKEQPQGASAALRRLVDEARQREPDRARARRARDAAAKFMWSIAGNLPGFEEASRALFANDRPRLEGLIRDWPEDVRAHLCRMLEGAQGEEGAGAASER